MKGIIKRAVAGSILLVMVSVIILSLAFFLSPRCRYSFKRLAAKTEMRIAEWRGLQPRLVSLSGKLTGSGAFIETLKGAQVLAVESTSGYTAMSDSEGNFTLPHLMWYPGATYNLIITADIHQIRRLKVTAPQDYPGDGNYDVGELRVDEGSQVDKAERPVRYLEYDSDNGSYYRNIFEQLTASAATDHQKISAICKYVATRHNPKQSAWSFKSARQILEQGAPHCSNLAFAMAAITGAGGYPTRTVHTSDTPQYLRTHVAVEVYYSGGWHLYDPTYGIFFLKQEGSVLSFKQLRLAPELITAAAFERIKPEITRSALEWMSKTYGSGFHQIYYVHDGDFATWCNWSRPAFPGL